MIKSLLRLWLALLLIVVASAVLLLTDRERPRACESSDTDSGSAARVRSIALFQHVSQATIEEGRPGRAGGARGVGIRGGPDDPGPPVQRRGGRRDVEYDRPGDRRGRRRAGHHAVDAQPPGDGRGQPRREAPARLRNGQRPGRGRRRHRARRSEEAPPVHGRPRDDAAGGRDVSDGPAARPATGESRRRLEPVGGQFRGLHEDRPDRLQGAGDRAARGERRRLGGRARGGRLAHRPRGRGDLGRRRQHGALVARRGDRPGAGGGRAGVHERPRLRCAGRLFDLGADYYRVGESIGQLAGRVLGGESPADMPILYEVPPEFWINRLALDAQTEGWSFPPEIDAKADVVVEKAGPVRRHPREQVVARGRARRPSRTWKVGLAAYTRVDHPGGGDRGVPARSQRGRPRRGPRLYDDLPQRPGRYRHAQRALRRAQRQRDRPGRQHLHAGVCRPRCGRSTASRSSSPACSTRSPPGRESRIKTTGRT